jgi:hypothetical protein
MLGSEELIIYAAMFGLLLGIVWALKYIVLIDRKIEKMDEKIERMLTHHKKNK